MIPLFNYCCVTNHLQKTQWLKTITLYYFSWFCGLTDSGHSLAPCGVAKVSCAAHLLGAHLELECPTWPLILKGFSLCGLSLFSRFVWASLLHGTWLSRNSIPKRQASTYITFANVPRFTRISLELMEKQITQKHAYWKVGSLGIPLQQSTSRKMLVSS